MKIFLTLQNKFLGILLTLAIIPLSLLGAYTVISTTNALEKSAINGATKDVSLRVEKIKAFLRGTESDLLFLSETPPIQGIIRARQGNRYDEVTDSSYDQWVDRLQVIFQKFAKQKPHYLQLRYLDETGQELVRIDSDGTTPEVIPKDQLQNKGQRYYFTATVKLAPGQIYISPLDLNRERGELALPYQPVIRYATPVYDADGKDRGIVIANIAADFFLKKLGKWRSCMQERTFLVDQDGFYLRHPDKSKEWGGANNRNTGANLKQDYPPVFVSQVFSGESREILTLEDEIISYQPIFPDSRNKKVFWVLIVSTPKNLFLQSVIHFRSVLIAIILFITGVSILCGVFFAKLLTDPIQSLMDAAQKISQGDFSSRIKVSSEDEIGRLADTFNEMANELSTMIDNLNKEITERKKTERELKETTAQVVQSEKLSAIGEVAAGVLHELSQPLNATHLICQTILKGIEKDRFDKESVKKDLPLIVKQVKKMTRIIDHMRGFSRRTEGTVEEEIDVNEVLENTFIFLGQQLEEHNVEVIKEYGSALPKPLGNVIRLEQVFMNLITNARYSVENSGKEDRKIEIKTYKRDDQNSVVTEITDNGKGIPENLREKIFAPFFTTKEKGKGTGLGLSISKKIIEEHRGRIEVESTVGEGATFRIVLPVGEKR